MCTSKALSYTLALVPAFVMLAGCSGGTPQMTPTSLGQVPGAPTYSIPSLVPGVAQSDAKEPGGLYIATFGTGSLPEYTVPDKKNLGPRCTDSMPAGGVNGIAVDAHRLLYVPYNLNSTHDVLTFGPNCGAPGPTLVDPNGGVAAVAIDNKKSIVYVGNYNTGNIEVYKHGATLPTGVLSCSTHGSGFGVAVDKFGDVFNSGGTIVEFPHGHNQGCKALALSSLIGPVGLSFDSNNNLLVDNEYNIAIYAPPYSGAPKQTITTEPFNLYCAIDAKNKNLYVSEQTNNAVDVYAYPAGTFEYSITAGIPSRSVSGVALDPPTKT
jgi:hypothetical protein